MTGREVAREGGQRAMEVQPGATDYVMFGHSGLFGDYVDIIHASGGRLRKVVTNLPDAPGHRSRRSFAEDLAAMNQWLKTKPEGRQIAREDLEAFAPGANVADRRDRRRSDRRRRKRGRGLWQAWRVLPDQSRGRDRPPHRCRGFRQ